jgi:methylenetetrahydrofolate reductase (NADPH)
MLGTKTKSSLSVEFYPPKDEEAESKLWLALNQLKQIDFNFASVTYGAGGSTRERTVRIAKEITQRSSIPTVAHLTCVGTTKLELIEILHQYKSAGVKRILALRGDPQGGPRAQWKTVAGGLDYAYQLVELAKNSGGLEIGVAAFPDGHPASNFNLELDIKVLLKKEELGATFATTQFFFDVKKWEELVIRLSKHGSSLPIIAGILPITNLRQLARMSELSGIEITSNVLNRFEKVKGESTEVKKIGIEIATELAQQLLTLGAPGIHFYTMNSVDSTLAIANNLGFKNKQ